MAEQLLRARLPGLRVASAGTSAPVGEAIHPLALSALAARGVEPQPRAARRLSREIVQSSRLVLGAERDHRTEAIRLDPRAADRAYTLKELARLLRATPAVIDDRDALDAVLSRARGALDADPPDQDDDIVDPLGGDLDAFVTCADEIALALTPLISVLLHAYGTGARIEPPAARGRHRGA